MPKTNIDIDCISPLFNIEGYIAYPSKNTGRGVIIYAKSNFCVSPNEYMNSLYDDASWCNWVKDNKTVLIGSIYRSPSNQNSCLNIIGLLNEAARLYNNILITGDFNMRDIDWNFWTTPHSEDHYEHTFIEALRDNFLYQHIDKPTRFRENQMCRTLDLVITKDESNIDNINIDAPLGLSDHATITFDFLYSFNEYETGKSKYKYSKCDFERFSEDLSNFDWDSSFEDKDISEMWKIFYEKYKKCVETYIPKTNPKPGCQPKPLWLTFDCLSNIKRKQKAWSRYLATRRAVDFDFYKVARNRANENVRKAKKEYEKLVASKAKTEPKHFWTYVKSKVKSKSAVSNLMKPNGNLTTSDKEKATVLNDFFTSVFTAENPNNIPNIEERNFESSLDHFVINQDTVEKYLLLLNGSKSMGPDNIHPLIVKSMANTFSKPLTLIFQKSIDTGKIPKEWKDARVTPLFKNKGSKLDAGNYRPVSLTSIVCKTLEKVIRKEMIDHLITNNLLSDSQFGFRSGRSCILQLLDVMEDWSLYMDNNISWDTLYLDFAKAFDKVPHKRLLKKLYSYGIRGSILEWITDFLTGRRQQVAVKGEKSEWQNVISGVPQGSVLGPVLFIIFINDLPDVVESIVKIFADDTKIYAPTSKSDVLQNDLDALYDWSKLWDMKFNVNKCKQIHYGRNNPENVYTMNNIDIIKDEQEKDLGIIFQNDLKFSQHISSKINKANSILGLINRTFIFKDQYTFLRLYVALVRPHVEYGNTIWYPHLKKDINAVEKVQMRATKLIPDIRHLSYEDRLKVLKLPSLTHRRRRGDMIQAFKILKGFEDISYERFFTVISTNTRGHNWKLAKPRCNTSFRLRHFSQRIINDWNNLPVEVISSKTVEAFKISIDRHWESVMYQLRN